MKIKLLLLLSVVAMGWAENVRSEDAPKLPSDPVIRQKILGAWAYDGAAGTNIIKVNRDEFVFDTKGKFTKKLSYTLKGKENSASSSGVWEVKDGAIVMTTYKTTMPNGTVKEPPKPLPVTTKIMGISDLELSLKSALDRNPRVYKRQVAGGN